MTANGSALVGTGRLTVEVDAGNGGRIAQIRVGDVPLLIGRDDVPADALTWGAYPMVPWAGRIREGRFEFRGDTYQLPRNHGRHAMHGVGFTSAWETRAHTPQRIDLRLDLPSDERWPFGGRVDHRIEVVGNTLRCTMTVRADERPFPTSFGWHPWFRKPDRLDFRPVAMFRRDGDHIAVDELVAVPDGPWDDCFVNDDPVGVRIDGVDVVLASECRHWVVYDEPDHATCVEPQTGPPDAFNISPRVVEPGIPATASFALHISGG